MAKNQKRVMLWAHPRSSSTAFLRCMELVEGCKPILEPYTMAYYGGTERIGKRHLSKGALPLYSYGRVQKALESPFEDFNLIFVKDMTFTMDQDHFKYLPAGYQHTFIIRHPAKSVPSMYKMHREDNISKALPSHQISTFEVGLESICNLLNYVKNQLGQEVIIIDSDDLCESPQNILSQYCDKIGIAFRESMLSWPQIGVNKMLDFFLFDFNDMKESLPPGFSGEWLLQTVHYNTTISTHFTKSIQESKNLKDLPENLKKLIDDCTPYYDFLYKQRIKPH